jgi:hypothetical protein
MSESELLSRVEELEAQVVELADLLATSVESSRRQPESVLWWPDLSPAEAKTSWTWLTSFVEGVLVPRYAVHREVLLPCWRQHGDVVDELTMIAGKWREAYTGDTSLPAAAEWLDRWLPGGMRRVREALSAAGCKQHEHKAVYIPRYLAGQTGELGESPTAHMSVCSTATIQG